MGKVADLSVFTPGGQPGAPNPSEGLAALRQNQTAFMETFGVMPPEALTIVDGAINPTRAVCIVDTEGGAPADDLMTINATLSDGSTLHDGMVILLSAKDASRVVTVKNSDAPNGMKTVDGKDIALSPEWSLVLQHIGGVWQQINVSAPLKPATETTLGGVKVGDGLTMRDGVMSADLATDAEAGRVKASETAKAGVVPVAKEDGTLDLSWLGLLNSRLVITESNESWKPPAKGWARVTVIGGGGSGGAGGKGAKGGIGGNHGGTSSFASISADGGSGGGGGASSSGNEVAGGGGGGAGEVKTEFVYLSSPVKIVIGAGGAKAEGVTSSNDGGDGNGKNPGKGGVGRAGGGGAPGASNGGGVTLSSNAGTGGSGGINGSGYGSGGGGGAGCRSTAVEASGGAAASDADPGASITSPSDSPYGGAGGHGAVILEYYDPTKEVA